MLKLYHNTKGQFHSQVSIAEMFRILVLLYMRALQVSCVKARRCIYLKTVKYKKKSYFWGVYVQDAGHFTSYYHTLLLCVHV